MKRLARSSLLGLLGLALPGGGVMLPLSGAAASRFAGAAVESASCLLVFLQCLFLQNLLSRMHRGEFISPD
jgi:O-antigen/teichoic acid export membrane protein